MMIAVIFEVEIVPGKLDRYLTLAAELKPLLAKIDGFIDIERFQSLNSPSRMLSLSWWRDEAAVIAWRRNAQHQCAQSEGKKELFTLYRIRVAALQREYGATKIQEVRNV